MLVATCCMQRAMGMSPQTTSEPATHIPSAPRPVPRTQTPFEEVIGSHIAEWAKQARESSKGAAAISPQARATPSSTGSAATHILPPAFVAAPFLSVPSSSPVFAGNSLAVDLNNDGKVDYVNVQLTGTIIAILNPGSFANLASLKPLPANTSANSDTLVITKAVSVDLNGDGNADLVGLDAPDSAIVVWLGKGDGTFQAARSYPMAPASGANWSLGTGTFVVGDFNGDGKPDVAAIAVAPYDFVNAVSIVTELTFLNQGDGTLAPGKEVDTSVSNQDLSASAAGADILSNDGTKPSGIVFALVNSGISRTGTPGTYFYVTSSKGDGSFTQPTIPTAPLLSGITDIQITATNLTASFPTGRAAGVALNQNRLKSSNGVIGSGIPITDIVAVNYSGAVYDIPYSPGADHPTSAFVLAGAPSSYGNAGNFPIAPNKFSLVDNFGLVIADFNGDGYQDILTTTPGTAYVFLNGGNHSFSGPPTQVSGASVNQIVAADFDNSGFPSFLWADAEYSAIGYFQNLGSRNVSQAGTFYSAPTVSGPSTNGGSNYYNFGATLNVQAVIDANGDGLQDVIAQDQSFIYRDGSLLIPDIVVGINNAAGLGKNEINGFSFETLISGSDISALGASSFVEPLAIKNPAGATILIATRGPANLFTVTYQGGGKIGTVHQLSFVGPTPQCNFYYADAGDVNGDGIADIVAAYPGDAICNGSYIPGSGVVNSGFYTFLGNADGTYQPGQQTPLGNTLFKIRLINFTGAKGALDVVAVDSYTPPRFLRLPPAYHNYLVPGAGDGTFDASSAVDIAPNYIVSDVVVGDYNMDGKQDLTLTTQGQFDNAAQSIIPNTMGALLMPGNGDRTFGAAQLVDQGIFPASGVYADFNGDGSPDLALSQFIGTVQPYVPALVVLPNLGGGVFGPSFAQLLEYYSYGMESVNIYIGEPIFAGAFSHSGAADLLITDLYNSSLFINQGAPSLTVNATPATSVQNSPVTLTASLVQGGNTVASATGAVTFSIGGSSLGSASMTGGVATFVTTALPVGSDTISVAYSGDAGDNPANGTASVTVTAAPPAAPSFTMTASVGTLSLAPGATGTVALSLTSNAAFSGSISFTCTGLPAEASCSVSPSSVSLGKGQTANAALVIATTAKNNSYQVANHSAWTITMGGISMAGLMFIAFPRRKRIPGTLAIVVFGAISAASILGLTGCGGSGDKYPGTPAGSYNVVVTATSGTITQLQVVALTINSPTQQ